MHTFGMPMRIKQTRSICEQWGLPLIEDAEVVTPEIVEVEEPEVDMFPPVTENDIIIGGPDIASTDSGTDVAGDMIHQDLLS